MRSNPTSTMSVALLAVLLSALAGCKSGGDEKKLGNSTSTTTTNDKDNETQTETSNDSKVTVIADEDFVQAQGATPISGTNLTGLDGLVRITYVTADAAGAITKTQGVAVTMTSGRLDVVLPAHGYAFLTMGNAAAVAAPGPASGNPVAALVLDAESTMAARLIDAEISAAGAGDLVYAKVLDVAGAWALGADLVAAARIDPNAASDARLAELATLLVNNTRKLGEDLKAKGVDIPAWAAANELAYVSAVTPGNVDQALAANTYGLRTTANDLDLLTSAALGSAAAGVSPSVSDRVVSSVLADPQLFAQNEALARESTFQRLLRDIDFAALGASAPTVDQVSLALRTYTDKLSASDLLFALNNPGNSASDLCIFIQKVQAGGGDAAIAQTAADVIPAPKIGFATASQSTSEGSTVNVDIRVNARLGSDLVVVFDPSATDIPSLDRIDVTLGGTVGTGDYGGLPKWAVLSADTIGIRLAVPITQDAVAEASETLSLTLAPTGASGVSLDANPTHVVTISD